MEPAEALLPSKRTRARRGDGARLREEILVAADRLLRETGQESNVSIDAIAKAVGCTAPSIYLHFPDRRTLLIEVCERYYALFGATLDAAGAAADDPLEALAHRGEAYVHFGLAHPEPYRLLFMHGPNDVPATQDIARVRSISAFDDQLGAVQRCKDAGYFPDGDVYEIACALWASAHGITSLLISKPGFPWPPLADFVRATVLAHGLGLMSHTSSNCAHSLDLERAPIGER